MTHDDTDLPTCPCCGYTTTKHPAAWECRRCGEARDFEEWFNDRYEEVNMGNVP